jgi:hypothetical protein
VDAEAAAPRGRRILFCMCQYCLEADMTQTDDKPGRDHAPLVTDTPGSAPDRRNDQPDPVPIPDPIPTGDNPDSTDANRPRGDDAGARA